MFNKLEQALKFARQQGADQAEVFASRSTATRVNVRNQEVEELKQANDVGFSIRILKNNSLGFAFSSELSEQSIESTVRKALDSAKFTTPDECNVLGTTSPAKLIDANSLQLLDPKLLDLTLDQKIAIAKQIETAAREKAKVTKTEVVSYFDHLGEIFLAHSEGFIGSYQGSTCGGSAEVIAEEQGVQAESGFGVDIRSKLADFDPLFVGNEAAKQAVQMLNGAPIATETLDIIFSPMVAIDFLEVLTPMLCADNVIKGKSLLAGKEGEAIASPLLTIIDNGLLVWGNGSAPFDAEGNPAQETIMVKGGTLKTFLYDNYCAKRCDTVSTGNAGRAGFMSLPSVSPTNIYIKAGPDSEAKILSGVARGFYVTRVMGLHMADPISGDFSLGASGLLIEKGGLTTPVRGVAIAGNLQDLMRNITAIGSNVRFVGSTGAPTLHMGKLTVSGK